MGRLTVKEYSPYDDREFYMISYSEQDKCMDKLGKLEDLMEKYDINIDELEYKLEKYNRASELSYLLQKTNHILAEENKELKTKILELEATISQRNDTYSEISDDFWDVVEENKRLKQNLENSKVYFISWVNDSVCKGSVIGYNEENKFCMICGDDMISADEIFATEQEAQQKLKEIKGE